MKPFKLIILTIFLPINTAFAQETNGTITINPTKKAGLLDGSCGNDEWEASTKIELPAGASIYLMHDKDYFYFCASGKAEDYTIQDLKQKQ